MNMIRRIADLDDPGFDPFASDDDAWGDVKDPYPILAGMRREAPVHHVEYRKIFTDSPDLTLSHLPACTVLGYDAVHEVLMNPQLYSNNIMELNVGLSFGRSIIVMDPPEHGRYRRIFQKAFLPPIVRQWGDEIVQPIVDRLVSKFRSKGRAELIHEFTLHYPFEVIYRQLDLPKEDIATFHKLAFSQLVFTFAPDIAREAGEKLGRYFEDLIRVRRARPGADLVSLLANAEVDGERLPEELVVSFLRQLVNAGGDTTYRATGTLLSCLLRDPDQLEAVRQDRTLLPRAIEEALRWDGPVLNVFRVATEDVELAGVPIKGGTVVNAVLGAANRDETRFPDPDRFDIYRTREHRHLGFGMGPHVCIGQHLARIEMERALNAIFDHLPNLRLDPDAPPPESRGFFLRSPRELRVVFDPA